MGSLKCGTCIFYVSEAGGWKRFKVVVPSPLLRTENEGQHGWFLNSCMPLG